MRTSLFLSALTLSCFAAIAQSSSVAPYDSPGHGSAINIAVSKIDEADGNAYFDEGLDYEKQGEYAEALTFFGKAAFEYNAIRKFQRYGDALMKMSNMHYNLAHYVEAEQVMLNVAIKNYSKIGSRTGLMGAYQQLGKIYLAGNRITECLWFYTQQGILAQQMGNNHAYIESVLGIAMANIRRKDYKLAERDLKRAEWLANSIRSKQYTGRIRDARNQLPVAKKRS
ncbi:hypothetical protein C7T94_01695 [Pedobacter yulinensis]|uniref:MalT-like TPR region domain-containing protein n=1 Tax=Pedobacter yulinensis TaxID=2126353 RepID=A0A2T3HR43_9SPHI|nr:hypothetical protein [Pedobacter yulinensis]PST84863.1 hypothetical protein C7T94_01695 [Pedobacter yulinensis]